MLMASSGHPSCYTHHYESTSGLRIELDLYLPPPSLQPYKRPRPTLVYFHGGGLTVGEKSSWFPFWLHGRALAAGFVFVSANYQLLPPATGHQILEDIKSLFAYLDNGINETIENSGREECIDTERIAVAGTSAGGLCAYLAGIHARPKPRAILSMYGMGGDFFTPHYFLPKTKPFFRGRELLDPVAFSDFLFPKSRELPPTSSSPLAYYGQDHPIPGYPKNPRMLLARLYLQLGNFIDYYVGEHQLEISETLRSSYDTANKKELIDWSLLIPPVHQYIFPQLNASAFPPTFFIHGSQDTAVPLHESHNLHKQLSSNGIPTTLRVCDGMEHSFDYEPDSEQRWNLLFDEAFEFLKEHLCSA